MTSHAPRQASAGTGPADPYTQVQQFYARQVAFLDDLRAEEFAATFTEDGVFAPAPGAPPARGRTAIAAALRAAHERRFGTEQVRRRHWHNMLRVEPGPDGTLLTHYYLLVAVTRPGEPAPVLGPSAVVEDVLVHDDTGGLLTRERRVTPDHLSF
ncbi:nuclear transport factor 2 family protein [Streptomyces sp. S.PB5]|uniref:nuclear transport factor 2 family protein n=1 Tax=Streptomyces sp. S.PB5 TaxID=3020844 RepID=UPI0025AFFAD2|nr:nuclear transport factor 2 family protein [Streptomyces sp. S.PB5]MDN3027275.1 nuclear transport factor 2 family protein [Streptomyces sp. S.PB5]